MKKHGTHLDCNVFGRDESGAVLFACFCSSRENGERMRVRVKWGVQNTPNKCCPLFKDVLL